MKEEPSKLCPAHINIEHLLNKPTLIWVSFWPFHCWAILIGISLWRKLRTSRGWHTHNPSWWHRADSTSHRPHKPSVPHCLPDRSQFHLDQDLRRPWSHGSLLGMHYYIWRGLRPARKLVEEGQGWRHGKQDGPSLWSSIWSRLLVLKRREDKPNLRTWKRGEKKSVENWRENCVHVGKRMMEKHE